MKGKFFLFFLFLLFMPLVFACTDTGPCQGGGYWCICGYNSQIGYNGTNVIKTGNLSQINIYNDAPLTYYMNYYFSGYNEIELAINPLTDNEKYVTLGWTDFFGNDTVECTDDNQYCLFVGYSGNVPYMSLVIKTLFGVDKIDNLIITGVNLTSDESAQYEVNVSFFNYNSPSYTSNNATTGCDLNSSFLGGYACNLLNLYPKYDSLTPSARYSIVIVTLLALSLFLYVMFYFTSGRDLKTFHHYIVFLIVLVMIFYFIALQYIPILFIILILLSLAAIVFFRVWGKGRN